MKERENKGSKLKKVVLIVAGVVVVGLCVDAMTPSKTEETAQLGVTTSTSPTEINESVSTFIEATEEPTIIPAPTTETYYASMYHVGTDMPAGEYILFADNGYGYFEVAKDATGKVESIIANNNFTYNTIVTVKKGQYLQMNSAYAVPFSKVASLDTSKSGMFKVGVHISAGKYKIVADGNYGYVEICKDSSHDLNSISSNDNFDGTKYIEVKNGQYVLLSNAHFTNETDSTNIPSDSKSTMTNKEFTDTINSVASNSNSDSLKWYAHYFEEDNLIALIATLELGDHDINDMRRLNEIDQSYWNNLKSDLQNTFDEMKKLKETHKITANLGLAVQCKEEDVYLELESGIYEDNVLNTNGVR